MGFNFHSTPGTRQRRSPDDEGLASVSMNVVLAQNTQEIAQTVAADVSTGTQAAAEKSEGIVKQDVTPVVKAAPKIKEPDEVEEEIEIIERCPTSACWNFNITTKTCSLKDDCTDVECTSHSIIDKGY